MGEIGNPAASDALFDLLNISKSERLRCAILEALSKTAPGDSDVVNRIREYAVSPLVSSESRAFAAALLVKIQGAAAASGLLADAKLEVIESVYTLARETPQIAELVLRHGVAHYARLSAGNRRLLISIAASCPVSQSSQVLLAGLQDIDPRVRQAAYQALGQSCRQDDHLPEILGYLCEHVDPLPTLEEEAQAAIQGMEKRLNADSVLAPETRLKIYNQIKELFKVLSAPERTSGKDGPELGWLIARSREYLEYYADEDFRKALLQYLKGGSYYTSEKLLVMLKASAVRVEVGHFDGYRAFEEIIKAPKRPGMGLLSRELAIAKLGKWSLFYRLIRCLNLTRLCGTEGLCVDAVKLFLEIFTWARQARLFRLAEAALYALAKADVQKASDVCVECLKLPLFSKICAIAGIHLLKELNWGKLEPAVRSLLADCGDAHILLNMVDAFSSMALPVSAGIVKDLIDILLRGQDRGVLQRVSDFLGSQSVVDVFESVKAGFERAEQWRQGFILSVVERKILSRSVSNRQGFIEFLYKILRGEVAPHQSRAAALLLHLGDDYAGNAVREFLINRAVEEKIDILRILKEGSLGELIGPGLLPLLRLEHAGVQEALRETLLSAEDVQSRARVTELALAARGERTVDGETAEESGQETQVQVDFQQEKKAYRFEKEHVQELAILFTDIQGYSKKAQTLDTLQLAALIHDYEGILLPTIATHGGELVKKMGDGHLFIFSNALSSVIAAIRLQKALKRFNSYREEALRLIIRVGIHWGKVMRKEGDVLGNHVNIASRLESSAKPGSILISEVLHHMLGEHIHAREIGPISVKGISEPMNVYEPYEIGIDLPEQLDPLKNKNKVASPAPLEAGRQLHDSAAAGPGNNEAGKVLMLDRKTLDYIVDTFVQLNRLCGRAELGQAGVKEVRRELTKRWHVLKDSLAKGVKR